MKFDFDSEETYILSELIKQKVKELESDPLVNKFSHIDLVI